VASRSVAGLGSPPSLPGTGAQARVLLAWGEACARQTTFELTCKLWENTFSKQRTGVSCLIKDGGHRAVMVGLPTHDRALQALQRVDHTLAQLFATIGQLRRVGQLSQSWFCCVIEARRWSRTFRLRAPQGLRARRCTELCGRACRVAVSDFTEGEF